jgi:hypothetical protein
MQRVIVVSWLVAAWAAEEKIAASAKHAAKTTVARRDRSEAGAVIKMNLLRKLGSTGPAKDVKRGVDGRTKVQTPPDVWLGLKPKHSANLITFTQVLPKIICFGMAKGLGGFSCPNRTYKSPRSKETIEQPRPRGTSA